MKHKTMAMLACLVTITATSTSAFSQPTKSAPTPPVDASSDVGNWGGPSYSRRDLILKPEEKTELRKLEDRHVSELRNLEDKYDRELRTLRQKQSLEREGMIKKFGNR